MIQYKFKTSGKTRMDHDLLGDKEVPVEALFVFKPPLYRKF